jgi:hypothetical protein
VIAVGEVCVKNLGDRMPLLPYEEACPINEQLLFKLYDAGKRGLPIPVLDVPPDIRSSVAVFCYRRGHLEATALVIAAMCDENELVAAGGNLGRVLFAKSRNNDLAEFDAPQTLRSKIALRRLQLQPPFDEEPLDEDSQDDIAGPRA